MLSRNLKTFKLVTFDCTNTLLYFKKPPSYQYLKTAVELGHRKKDFDENILQGSFKKHFKQLQSSHPNFGRMSLGYHNWWTVLVQNVLSDASKNKIHPHKFKRVADKLIDLYATSACWEKFERSDELITALKNDGKIVGVISNFDPRLHELLRDMNLYYNFDFVITSYEVNVEKPKSKIFQHALDRTLGIAWNLIYPYEALHIGNEIDKDYDGARDSGWSSVLINSEKINENTFKDIEEFWNVINTKEIEL